jgi:hypothetical protein
MSQTEMAEIGGVRRTTPFCCQSTLGALPLHGKTTNLLSRSNVNGDSGIVTDVPVNVTADSDERAQSLTEIPRRRN